MACAARCLVSAALGMLSAQCLTIDREVLDMSTGIDSIILPRAVVHAAETDGCGKDLTGYLKTGAGLLWSDNTPGHAVDLFACRKRCDSAKNCVAFTAREPRRGKFQCNLYKGLVSRPDRRAVSYAKCAKGVACPSSDGIAGFSFAHAGVWANGVRVELHSKGACAKTCAQDKACVGFSHRLPHHGMHECYHYNFTANGEGPRRDMRAQTYSKCAIPAGEAPSAATAPRAPVAGAPSLPFGTAVVHKDDTDKCGENGFMMASTGWWWSDYTKLAKVGNVTQCEQECNSLEGCTYFIHRTANSQLDDAECYLYKGLVASYDNLQIAYRKCQVGGAERRCDSGSPSPGMRIGRVFSHHGSWQGGRHITEVSFLSCQLLCNSQVSCVAWSWGNDQVCSLFQPAQQKFVAPPRPTDGAVGFSKCQSVDEEAQ